MKRDLIIRVLSKRLSIDKNIVEEAYSIIENSKSPLIDDIFLSNLIASNMSISPTNAVNISFEYNKIKNKSEEELAIELDKEETKEKSKVLFWIIGGIILLVLIIIFLHFSTHT